jgi:hypothetical protein
LIFYEKCKCEECTKVGENAIYKRLESMKKGKLFNMEQRINGTLYQYRHGCKCNLCMEVNRLYSRRKREKRKEKLSKESNTK